MIYLLPISGRVRRPSMYAVSRQWIHEEAPEAKIFNIQRPFAHLSVGPIIIREPEEEAQQSLKEYKKWMFKRLLVSKGAIDEFNGMLDVLIQEGDIILQCSCIPPKPCHGTIIKSALEWAAKLGTEGWHPELKKIAAGNFARKRK